MPVLVVTVPGKPDLVLPIEMAVVVGRASECDVVLDDPKASGRHLRIAPHSDGSWVVQDLGSTRGLLLGSRRVMRTTLAFSDELVVGETRIQFLEREPLPAPKKDAPPAVGGTLAFERIEETESPEPASAPAHVPAPASSSEPVETEPAPVAAEPAPAALPMEEMPDVLTRPVDSRSMGRAVLIVIVGLLVVIGVEFGLGRKARVARELAQEREDLSDRIQRSDISPETFAEEVELFLARHPDTSEKDALLAYLEGVRALEAERVRRETQLNSLAGGLHDMSESEVRGVLLELQRTLKGDEAIARQARLALENLERRHHVAETAALESAIHTARTLVVHRDPAGALRRLTAFRSAWPAPNPDVLARLHAVEEDALVAARQLAENALAAGESMTDPVERRKVLGAAWRGLAGLPQGDLVAEALRFTRTERRTPSGTGTTPGVPEDPGIGETLLAKAALAEKMIYERHWSQALETLKELIDGSDPGRLQREWKHRSDEVRLVLGLVDALKADAASESPPRPRLKRGRVKVVAADVEGVDVLVGVARKRLVWAEVAAEDLLSLLTPKKPDVPQRLGLAVLAASQSLREEVVRVLIPLFEKEEAVTEASNLVARHVHGLAEPPVGGYRVYKGEILDRESYARRLKAERVTQRKGEAEAILAKVLAVPAFKKLDKLAERRKELDKRRRYALLAIFNETHYPYPYVRGSEQYREVQQEIDRRVAQVREIWDDPYDVKITTKGALSRLLKKWGEAVAALKRLDADVEALEAQMAPKLAYATGEPITIREYFRDLAERELLAYNRWVMGVYNPGQDREATSTERKQTRITNDYRMMLGYAASVVPGRALYDAIAEDTVVRILDEGTIEYLKPLRAVRIDDRLVLASRLHSIDMQRRGFFNHFAPANPATGDPRTSPFDRMQKQGYKGGGASENIAAGSASPEAAHNQWIHSSGHHRNILSPWHDQGVGQSGRHWTQNFGIGGGRKPRIEDEPTTTDADDGPDRAGNRK